MLVQAQRTGPLGLQRRCVSSSLIQLAQKITNLLVAHSSTLGECQPYGYTYMYTPLVRCVACVLSEVPITRLLLHY